MRFAIAALVFATAVAPLGAAAQTLYTSRTTFTAAAGPLFTDDYQSGYGATGSTRFFSDAQMTAVKGVTQYTATGNPNTNIVFTGASDFYCAGCNGSFRLSFTSAAFGGSGTTAFGFNYANGQLGTTPAQPYTLFVTYANGTTQNVALVVQTTIDTNSMSFIGVTSPVRIVSAHLGLSGGGATNNGGFVLDNLSVSVVPEPAAAAMLAAGLLLLAGARRQRRG